MFNRFLATGALALALGLPQAQAYTVQSVQTSAGVSLDHASFSSADMLSLDLGFAQRGFARLDISTDAGDGPTLALNGLLQNLMGEGLHQLRLVLDGASWAALGDAQGTFGSVAAVSGSATQALIEMQPHEYVEVAFGDWFLSGSQRDFAIDLRGVDGRFSLSVQVVPEPATLALAGLALVATLGGAARRRRGG